MCFDALMSPSYQTPWRLSYFVKEAYQIASHFDSVSFFWVSEEANKAAHALARWPLNSSLYGYLVLRLAPQCFDFVISGEAGY